MTAAEVYPIIIAEWQRNSREIVRVALDRFNNRETIDIRSWWQDGEGNWRPGRGGLTLSVKHLPALADGLADALDRARALGLIESAGNTNTTKDRTAAERQRRYRQRRNGHDRNGARDVTDQ
jgi:Transcriptional Coactivator p15 (PC4)